MSTKIKLVSFDLWGTLIKSNPDFKPTRAKFVARELFGNDYNTAYLSSVSNSIRKIELFADRLQEDYCSQLCTATLWSMVLMDLGIKKDKESLLRMIAQIDAIPLSYPPSLIQPVNVVRTLRHLKSKDIRICILSNTCFITGETLSQVLVKLKIDQYFDHAIFSDQVRLCKPSKEIFDILGNLRSIARSTFKRDEILHVGDNPKTDGVASKYGFHELIINTQVLTEVKAKTIKDVINRLN